jgi:TRAP-type C4-dicarboxylate transport system permease small subunit
MMPLWRYLQNVCLAIGVAALAGLVILPSVQIVLRLIHMPFIGSEEVTRYLLIVSTFIVIPVVTSEAGQIKMDDFIRFLPARALRVWRAVIAAVAAGSFALIVLATIESLEITMGSSTPTVGIPFWLFNLPALIGLTAGATEYLKQIVRPPVVPTYDHLEPL